MITSIIDQIEDLEKQVKESQDWANHVATQVEKKLSSDMTELKILKIKKSETQKPIKGKLVLDDTITKRMTHVDNFLRNITSEMDQAHGYLRRLETQNTKIKVKMEAYKLGNLELNTNIL